MCRVYRGMGWVACILPLILLLSFPAIASQDSLTILMVTFRGFTDAEKGFTEYFQKKNLPVRFVMRDCNNDKKLLAPFVKELPTIKPDLIYAFGTTAALELADRGIPLVFNIVADPVGARLVQPGNDITGVCHIVPMPVQVKAIQSVLPITTVGVLYNPEEKNSALMVNQLELVADSCRFNVIRAPVTVSKDGSNSKALSEAVDKLATQNIQLLYLPSDSYIISHAAVIVNQAVKHKLPVYSATEEPLKTGALLGVVSRYYNAGQFAGYKAEQILFKKMRARDIPVETLSRFSFVVNMKTAHDIGFIPPILTLKFAEVITE